MEILTELMMKASSWLTLLPRISLRNIFEIAIISFLVYEILFWIKNTRAWTLLKGLLTILVFAIVAVLLRLDTIVWILKNITAIAVTAFLVVFQPELRKALEQLGSQNLLSGILAQDDGKSSQEFNDRTVNELVRATFEMAKVKTGALMVIERGTSLKEIERTGIEISGLVTSQLLINIFEHNTPLHDGAVVIGETRWQLLPAICLFLTICPSTRRWEPDTAQQWESVRQQTALPLLFQRKQDGYLLQKEECFAVFLPRKHFGIFFPD